MPGFKFRKSIQPRYSDFDMMQHLNNATYATYFEYGRLHYLLEVAAGEISKISNVVVSIQIDFRMPVVPYAKPIICLRCSRLGTKSFDFEYLIVDADDESRIYATGKTVQVCVNVEGKSVEMPADLRKRLQDFEEEL